MAHPVPQIGEVVAERYEIESILGRGGMGVVFAARHTLSGRRVALKWMEPDPSDGPDAKERFLREARAMGRIEHGNVVGVLDVGTVGEAAYLVMEHLRGESLRAVIEREAPMPIERALALLLPAMEGVEAAHRAGVVHRDLKPENLFVAKLADGGTVTKVLDFGISKLDESTRSGSRTAAPNLTKTGHVVGTPQYMSPEQVRGVAVDARTDVWALGTILYEMLTANVPFEAENFGGLLVAIATEAHTPLHQRMSDAPTALALAINRCLEKEPARRFPSVLAFARVLEPLAGGLVFREPSGASVMPASPFAETRSTPSTPQLLELENVTAPAKPGVKSTPLPATVQARKSPARGSAARPVPIEALEPNAPREEAAPREQTGDLEIPGGSRASRAWLAIGAAVVCVVLAGVALAFSGSETEVAVSEPVLLPPAPVAVVPPPAPPPPVVVARPVVVTPPIVVAPPEAPAPTAPARVETERHRPHVRAPVVAAVPPPSPVADPVPPTPPPTTTSPTTASSRSGSISRDDF